MIDWHYIIYYAQIIVGMFLVFTLMAYVTRGRSALSWPTSLRKSAVVNFVLIQVNKVLGWVFLLVLIPLSNGYEMLGLPQIPRSFWESLPLPLTGLFLFLVYDFILYWVHRAMHTSWLWPAHAVHHSDTDLHFLSWSRSHVVETVIIYGATILGATWLGLQISEIYVLALIQTLHQYYVHSNIDWSHGIFRKWIVSPQLHRWHHADDPKAWDKNFATIFPFYDVIFGTYYYPGSAVNVPTGFKEAPGHNVIDLIMYPFNMWVRMIKARIAGTSSSIIAASDRP